jgi:hypothetical protein
MNPASLCKALMTDNKGLPTERDTEREREREREQYRSNGSALLKSFETQRERDHQMSLLFFCSSIT